MQHVKFPETRRFDVAFLTGYDQIKIDDFEIRHKLRKKIK